MKNLYPGDYRTANSIDSHTTPIGIAAGMSGSNFPSQHQGTLNDPHPLAVRMRYPPMRDGDSSAALTALGVQHMTRDK